MSEYVGDVCSFFTHVSKCGPSVLGCWWGLLFFWGKAGRFLWPDWERIIIQDVVDHVHFPLDQISYRSLGKTYRSHLQGVIVEDETDRLSRNVGKKLPSIACIITQKKAFPICFATEA
jgi:hypothetical protein